MFTLRVELVQNIFNVVKCALYVNIFRALLQSMAAPLKFRRQTVRRMNQEAVDR